MPSSHKEGVEPVVRVLLIDDRRLYRQGFKFLMEQDLGISVVGEADNGNTAVQLLQFQEADLVLIALEYQERLALEALEIVRDRRPDIKILMLCSDLDRQGREGLAAGAAVCVLMDIDPKEFIRVIKIIPGDQKPVSKIVVHHREPSTSFLSPRIRFDVGLCRALRS
jgi:DNA-binding NarL/FixJ family response regulator